VHRRVVVYVVAGLLVAALAGVLAWRLLDGSSTYEDALDTVPKSTLRATYTDWAQVRRLAHGTSLDSSSSAAKVQAFLNRAYDRGLTSGSGVDESTRAMARRFGFSPLDVQWEVLGQSRKGQVDVMRLDDGVDTDHIERALNKLGYDGPGGVGKAGTWAGSSDLVARIDPDLTPLQQNFAVLPDQHLVLMSDDTAYVAEAADVAKGSGDSLLDVAGVGSLAKAAKQPVTSVQWASTFACEDLAMGAADAGDQDTGKRLIALAGKVSPLEGLVMAQQPDRHIVVGMHFETSSQASENLQTRVNLASGDAPGQGGTFGDRFRVTSGDANGHDVVLQLAPRAGQQQVLSDISTGPVLFATC
jgi:hypothetical protein